MDNIWDQIEPLLLSVSRPGRYINHEWGCVAVDNADFNFCMIYPDVYEIGQSNQAIRILVNCVNKLDGYSAQRGFLPASDMCDLMRKHNIPLFSIEGCNPVGQFDLVGITLPHELCATNVLEVLYLAGVAIRTEDRSESDPIIVGGGPCSYNPEPYAAFFDCFSIGEGEESIPELCVLVKKCRDQGLSKKETLMKIALLPGYYVPQFYDVVDDNNTSKEGLSVRALPNCDGVASVVEKRTYDGFSDSSAWEPCIVPYVEVVHDRLNVEVLRGCSRGCRFCQAGMVYRPVRERSSENIIDAVDEGLRHTGYDEVSLTSLSTTDHSCIKEILGKLNSRYKDKGIRISIPSQRLDSFGVEMANLVSGAKKGGLTFAVEAGTQRLRDVINKNVTEDDLFSAIEAAFSAGWRRCKLYFMIGLPSETDEDVKAIASLTQRAFDFSKSVVPQNQRRNIKFSVSCSLFVPKSHTPFQWDGQITCEEAKRRFNLICNSIKYKAINVSYSDPYTSFIEAVLSRGGRECSMWIESAWRNGARFDAWNEFFDRRAWERASDEVGFDVKSVAQKTYDSRYVMPWFHISSGVSNDFLAKEREKSLQGITTPDCTMQSCSFCGVCSSLSSKIKLAGKRNAL